MTDSLTLTREETDMAHGRRGPVLEFAMDLLMRAGNMHGAPGGSEGRPHQQQGHTHTRRDGPSTRGQPAAPASPAPETTPPRRSYILSAASGARQRRSRPASGGGAESARLRDSGVTYSVNLVTFLTGRGIVSQSALHHCRVSYNFI